jgi:hypothetical protein
MAGKTQVSVRTKKLRGKSIVRGGAITATRAGGLLDGILTYAVEAGIVLHRGTTIVDCDHAKAIRCRSNSLDRKNGRTAAQRNMTYSVWE